MKHLIFIISSTFIFVSNIFACECDYQGSFFKVSKNSSFVAEVKVIKYLTFKDIYGKQTPMSMEVEIVDVYKGKEKRKVITVWGDPGNLCRPYLSEFKEGGYYVIAFSPAGKNNYEKSTDYSISICGAYWLNIDIIKSTVTGDIDSKDKTLKIITLAEFKSEFLKNGN